ncbi:MAG: acyltransferase [Rhodanobacteraceae bacterium]|nr:acyltransferase [Rhodanobacteraceae bacterium]
MAKTSVHQNSAVRKHLDRGVLQRLYQWRVSRKLGFCGTNIYIDRNAQFLRHPGNVKLGADTVIKEGVRICPAQPDATITIGEWTSVGYHTFIFATSQIDIGANCLIAPFCYLVDANHGIRRDTLIRNQPMSAAPIRIGDDVWLGTGVAVLKGVQIGRGAVVAAGSVVSSDIPEYAISAGNPAVVIGERK